MTNFTNNFELNKAHHDSFFKKASENDIEKGGEGSRGGKVIGHTESGKPIYENHDHPAHKDFTSNDHTDAVYAHVNLTSRKSLATKEEKKKHLEEGKKHGASSHTAKQDPDSLDEYKQEEGRAKNKGDVGSNVWKVNFKHPKSGSVTNSTVRASNQKEAEATARERLGHSNEHKVISAFEVPDETPYERGKKEAEAQAKLTPEERKAKREKDANWTGNEVYRHFKNSLKKSEDTDSLQKAFEVLGLPDAYDRIEKGGKPALVGEIRDFGGRKMIKTKMGPNSWRPYSPGGKHEHLTDSKKEPSKEETKTESKVESKQEVENKQPAKEKEVGGKEKHGYENYDHMKQVDHVVAHYNLREDEMKKQGVKYASDYSKDSRDYVGDEKASKLKERIQKELPALEHHKTSSKQILGTENITIVDPKIDSSVYSSSYSESGNKIAYNSEKKQADIVSRRVKEAYDFATQPHVKKEIKKIDNFCKREGLKASIDYHNIHSPNGKSGTMKMRFWAPSSNDDRNFSIDVAFDRAGNMEFHELGHSIEMSALDRYDNMDSKSLANLKTLKKFSLEFNPDHKDDSGKIDEKWIDLKSKFENYYSGRDGYSQVTKVDDNTIHFTAGDVGKKKQTHDTVKDAARLSPPSSIGDYKLVASDKVIDHKGNLVDKKDVISNMLKRDNEYSEYENNVDFTYMYKKK